MRDLQFHYFSGMEAEQYSFHRMPKMLFTEECFRSLSCEAKVLYGLMLDRMGLSLKNRWLDEKGRVYIIFTVEEIAETMNCGIQKAVKLDYLHFEYVLFVLQRNTSKVGNIKTYLLTALYNAS